MVAILNITTESRKHPCSRWVVVPALLLDRGLLALVVLRLLSGLVALRDVVGLRCLLFVRAVSFVYEAASVGSATVAAAAVVVVAVNDLLMHFSVFRFFSVDLLLLVGFPSFIALLCPFASGHSHVVNFVVGCPQKILAGGPSRDSQRPFWVAALGRGLHSFRLRGPLLLVASAPLWDDRARIATAWGWGCWRLFHTSTTSITRITCCDVSE